MLKKFRKIIFLGVFAGIHGLSHFLHLTAGVSKACRFFPTCSIYAKEAFEVLPFWQAVLVTFKRLIRCQPWGGSGVDSLHLRGNRGK